MQFSSYFDPNKFVEEIEINKIKDSAAITRFSTFAINFLPL